MTTFTLGRLSIIGENKYCHRVCNHISFSSLSLSLSHTHTHTHFPSLPLFLSPSLSLFPPLSPSRKLATHESWTQLAVHVALDMVVVVEDMSESDAEKINFKPCPLLKFPSRTVANTMPVLIYVQVWSQLGIVVMPSLLVYKILSVQSLNIIRCVSTELLKLSIYIPESGPIQNLDISQYQ